MIIDPEEHLDVPISAYTVTTEWKCKNKLCLIEKNLTVIIDPTGIVWNEPKTNRVCPGCGFKTLAPKPTLIGSI